MARTLTITIDLDRLDQYRAGRLGTASEVLEQVLTDVARKVFTGGTEHVVWYGTANVGQAAYTDDQHVTIANPDDPFGAPAYDGLASEAYKHLVPAAYDAFDGEGNAVCLMVRNDDSRIIR